MTTRREFLAPAAGATLLAHTANAADKPALAPPDKQPPKLEVPSPPSRTVGFAIVGLGELALSQILPAFAESTYARPVALVSGHRDKARKVAARYGIGENAIYDYATYDQLSQNKDVDAVYIVLPNSMHADFTVRGFRAGKHVLCEKPMAVSVAEAERMIGAGKDARKKLMIAYRLHYEPFNAKVIELAKSAAFGPVKSFISSNAQNVQAPNIRLSAQLGGGPVGDVGVYSINAARYVIREEPNLVTAIAYRSANDPRFREVPESVTFTLQFPSGAIAHCDCGFASAVNRFYRVSYKDTLIAMDRAFGYSGQSLRIVTNEAKNELQIDPLNHFAAEMDHFARAIIDDTAPLTPGEEGLADMRVIAAIDEAIRTGKPVKVKA
jgi:predicted dehydrogenase